MTPTEKKNIRLAISNFCSRAEAARLSWAYTRRRPYTGLGVVPEANHQADCSSYCALAFYWAMHKTGLILPDPLNYHYSGYGFTGSQYDFLKTHPVPIDKYLVGDMAIFGTASNTVHTSICRKGGTAETAIFSSNGHQSWIFGKDAPEPISLAAEKAQQNIVGVYRHPSLL